MARCGVNQTSRRCRLVAGDRAALFGPPMKKCLICQARGAWTCERCKTEKRRIAAIHGRHISAKMADPDREWRLRMYTLLASARRPLFAGHR